MEDLFGDYSSVIRLKKTDFNITNKNLLINNKNFKNKQGLIIFNAPWCSHCRKSVDIFNDIAQQYLHKYPIGSVNMQDYDNENDHLHQYISIKTYPKIMIVSKDGTLHQYKGDISRDSLLFHIVSTTED